MFPDRDHFGRIFYNQANLSSMGIPQVLYMDHSYQVNSQTDYLACEQQSSYAFVICFLLENKCATYFLASHCN